LGSASELENVTCELVKPFSNESQITSDTMEDEEDRKADFYLIAKTFKVAMCFRYQKENFLVFLEAKTNNKSNKTICEGDN
jgi:hypothetical protein